MTVRSVSSPRAKTLRPRRRRPCGWPAAVLLAGSVATALVTVRVAAEAPTSFAIREARIVPVSGPVLEKGTIVVASGLIVGIGADIAVPPEAWVIDGKGLTVYPGLIDAGTDLGLTSTPAPSRAGPPASPDSPRPTSARGPEDRPASTPWVQAADELTMDERRFESWRASGFTTALTAPRNGILPGQGAVINLAGERPGDMVLRAPASLQLNLQTAGGFGSFPGSLMGVVAYVRQVFLDSEHAAVASRAWESDARGAERPDYDRTVRALQQAQSAGLPVLIPAQTPVQITRALALARELKLRPVIVGAQQGYRAVEALAADKTPVIVSLKWPERDTTTDPEAPEMLRSLRVRAEAPSTPGALERAGVPFAFSSDGVPPRDLPKHVRKALDAGLTPEAALRAFTIYAARILNVDRRVGTLEAGKIANLIVTDGDLFAERTKVKMTFIDGAKFEIVEAARPAAGGDRQTASLTGRWTLSVTTPPDRVEQVTADVVQAGDGTLTGTITLLHLGAIPIARGSITGNTFSFSATIPQGPVMVPLTFSGTLDGATVRGTTTAGNVNGDFTGTRSGPSRAGDDLEAR